MSNPMRIESSRPALSPLGLMVVAGLLAGCGDPIYDSFELVQPTTDLTLTSRADTSRYEWPQTREGYQVTNPPAMAYVTSFEAKLKVPDPVTAELVPWSSEGLDPEMVEFLDQAYKPVSLEMEVVLRLASSQFVGPQAFDISADGTRLVVIEGKQLVLYRADDGSRIGRMPLPAEIVSAEAAADAIRFCGTSKDMLVGSREKIIRISSKDGSVSGETKGCGEPIAQWIITPDDQAMLVRSESGRLFGGDPQLKRFRAYDELGNLRFGAASLSPDGNRIGVVFNGVPRTYLQSDFMIDDQVDYKVVTLDNSVSIASGVSSDAWVDGDGIFYTTPRQDGKRDTDVYHMFWKPLQISATLDVDGDGVTHYLMVGRRFVDGQEQWVMFEFGPINGNNSFPNRLDELPIRYAHSGAADRVAIVDSSGLRLCKREAFRTRGPVLWPAKIYNWVDQGKFAEIEQMLEIIQSQTRLGFGRTAESLRTFVLQEIAARWMYLTENDPNSPVIAGLEQWRDWHHQLGYVVDGLRHYRLAWNARGTGTINSVSERGLKKYREHLDLAAQQLDLAIMMENPPVVALEARISVALEQGHRLPDVDHWCRLATELYPTEIDPHDAIAIKLLPQWFGDRGDAVNHALSVAKMFEGPEGDYKYVWLINGLIDYIRDYDPVIWRSYDGERIRRGLEESFRRKVDTGDRLGYMWIQLHERTQDSETANLVLQHLMANLAAPPYYLTHGDHSGMSLPVHVRAEALRSQASGQ